MLCSRKTSVTFIATLIGFVTTSLVCENKNNSDKLYRRKSMRTADEPHDNRRPYLLGPY